MAPPAVVYVVAAVVGVAAAFAFKEFVYEPHIAPTLEAWAESFLQRRRAARNRRASAVPVRASRRRTSSNSSHSAPLDNNPQRDRGESERSLGLNDFSVDGLELEALASKEVDEWRNEVLRSQERIQDGLRKRRTKRLLDDFDGFDSVTTTLDESFTSLTHTPLASTHVISNVSSPLTPSTVSLPQTPIRRLRSESQSTTTQENCSTMFIAHSPPSPIHEIPAMSPRAASPRSAALTPRPPSDSASHLDTTSSVPVVIPITDRHSSITQDTLHPLSFTPTYRVMADDSPFGPLLPDTPSSSAEMYGERPFSPITRVMGSSSGAVSVSGSKTTLPSSVSSIGSTRMLDSSGMLRKPSGLVNEVVINGSDDGSDEEDHPHASLSTFTLANPGPGNESVVSSLSERYPAPPTPPVIISPPESSVGILSAPSSPRSSSPEVVFHQAIDTEPYRISSPIPQTRPPVPLLQVPSEPSIPGMISRSRSAGHPAMSPALSYASFLSPMPMSRAASESDRDEFLSVASDDSDWGTSPVTPSRNTSAGTGPVQDRANSPFLDFEHLTHNARRSGSEHGSEGSEVLVSELEQEGRSEASSDESWGSAMRH